MDTLINKSLEIFETSEMWENYLELAKIHNKLIQKHYSYNSNKIVDFFREKNNEWGIIHWGFWDYKWFLKNYGPEAVCLWQWGNEMGIFIPGYNDNTKVQEIANNEKYNYLKYLYPNTHTHDTFYSRSHNNFNFESSIEITFENIAWFIKNDFQNYLSQLDSKVDVLMKDPKAVHLIKELNHELASLK